MSHGWHRRACCPSITCTSFVCAVWSRHTHWCPPWPHIPRCVGQLQSVPWRKTSQATVLLPHLAKQRETWATSSSRPFTQPSFLKRQQITLPWHARWYYDRACSRYESVYKMVVSIWIFQNIPKSMETNMMYTFKEELALQLFILLWNKYRINTSCYSTEMICFKIFRWGLGGRLLAWREADYGSRHIWLGMLASEHPGNRDRQ